MPDPTHKPYRIHVKIREGLVQLDKTLMADSAYALGEAVRLLKGPGKFVTCARIYKVVDLDADELGDYGRAVYPPGAPCTD